MSVTYADQLACVVREIGMRERCYPQWVLDGKMGKAKADAELERMRAVAETLRPLAEHEAEIAAAQERLRNPSLFDGG